MRRFPLVAAVALLSGCGVRPVNAELYALVVDFFRPPATCYSGGMQPTTGVTADAARVVNVEVWDGPESTAFLEVVDTLQVDMGDAPTVTVNGVLSGTRGSEGWTFSMNRSATNMAGGNTLTSTSSATLTFPRDATFKGKASLSSSRTCTGAMCPQAASCTISDLVIHGTRLQVDWQQAP